MTGTRALVALAAILDVLVDRLDVARAAAIETRAIVLTVRAQETCESLRFKASVVSLFRDASEFLRAGLVNVAHVHESPPRRATVPPMREDRERVEGFRVERERFDGPRSRPFRPPGVERDGDREALVSGESARSSSVVEDLSEVGGSAIGPASCDADVGAEGFEREESFSVHHGKTSCFVSAIPGYPLPERVCGFSTLDILFNWSDSLETAAPSSALLHSDPGTELRLLRSAMVRSFDREAVTPSPGWPFRFGRGVRLAAEPRSPDFLVPGCDRNPPDVHGFSFRLRVPHFAPLCGLSGARVIPQICG